MRIEAFFDGACAPVNPGGTASWGFVIKVDGGTVESGHGIVGKGFGMTNNVAETAGLTELLRCILDDFAHATEVWIRGDSNIVIRQMNGKGKKRPNGHYASWIKETHSLATRLRSRCFVCFEWIPREQNSEADALADAGFIVFDQDYRMRMAREE